MKFYKTLFLLTTLIGGSYVCYKKIKGNSTNEYKADEKEDGTNYWFENTKFEEEEILNELENPSVFELNDFSFVLKACSQNGLILKLASDELRDNKNIVMVACNNFGLALQYASDRLKDDEEVVKIAYEQDRFALDFASDRLQEKFEEEEDLEFLKMQWGKKYDENTLLSLKEICENIDIPEEKAYYFFTRNNIKGIKDKKNHNKLMYTISQIDELFNWWSEQNKGENN